MPVFASIHLGKCAGAAFANLLIERVSQHMPVLFLYGEAHPLSGVWRDRSKQTSAAATSPKQICGPLLEQAEKGESFLVQSHFGASEYLEFLPNDSKFFTWLRHPLQRISSHYYYWKNNRREPRLSPEAKPLFQRVVSGECSLVEFGCHPLVAEYYRGMLGPLGLDGLALAAVVEHSSVSFGELSRLLDVELPLEMRVANATRSKPAERYELTAEQESQLRVCNTADLKLYERAVARLLGEQRSG